MKVLVRAYTNYNLGDDLFLDLLFTKYSGITFKLIAPKSYYSFVKKYPNVEIVLEPSLNIVERICSKILGILFRRKVENFMRLKHWDFFLRREKKECNLFLYIGGSIFMQYKAELSLQDVLNGRITKWFDKTMILGANFGPFIEQKYVEYYSKTLAKYNDVCFRDSYSYKLFDKLPNVRLASDIIFQYPICKNSPIEKSVGISMMDFSFRLGKKKHAEFIGKISELIYRFLPYGYSFYLFSFCKNEGDEKAIQELKFSLPSDINLKCLYYDGNIDAFLEAYSRIETMIVTRFHSLVLSLLYGQKIYPIIYSKKVSHVLSDISFNGSYTDISNIESADIKSFINNATSFNLDLIYLSNAKKQFYYFDRIVS